MNSPAEAFLHEAVERGSAMVLTLPSGGMLRHYKSRFLGSDALGIWVEADIGEIPLLNALIAAGTPVGVSCKLGPEKLKFVAPIVRLDAALVISAASCVFPILIKHPKQVELRQRRNDYRICITSPDEVGAQAWQIPEHVYLGDRPTAKQSLNLELSDLSIGGIGFMVTPKKANPPRVTEGERLRVSLSAQGSTILVEARVAFAMPDEAEMNIQCGAGFAHLERDVDGRQKLAWLGKIIGQLQRDEVKRHRRAAG